MASQLENWWAAFRRRRRISARRVSSDHRLMHSTCPKLPVSAPLGPCWCTMKKLFSPMRFNLCCRYHVVLHRAIQTKKVHWLANEDETQVSLVPLSGKCLDDKSANRVVVRINGRHKNYITVFLHFAVQLEHGTDEEGGPCIKFGRVVKLKPVLIWVHPRLNQKGGHRLELQDAVHGPNGHQKR